MYYINGNGDEVTIENFIDPDDDDNILESMEPDGDGFYTIASMAMPYRDVTLEINTEDKKMIQHIRFNCNSLKMQEIFRLFSLMEYLV